MYEVCHMIVASCERNCPVFSPNCSRWRPIINMCMKEPILCSLQVFVTCFNSRKDPDHSVIDNFKITGRSGNLILKKREINLLSRIHFLTSYTEGDEHAKL